MSLFLLPLDVATHLAEFCTFPTQIALAGTSRFFRDAVASCPFVSGIFTVSRAHNSRYSQLYIRERQFHAEAPPVLPELPARCQSLILSTRGEDELEFPTFLRWSILESETEFGQPLIAVLKEVQPYIRHLEMRAPELLLSPNHETILCDASLSSSLGRLEHLEHLAMPFRWMSPEWPSIFLKAQQLTILDLPNQAVEFKEFPRPSDPFVRLLGRLSVLRLGRFVIANEGEGQVAPPPVPLSTSLVELTLGRALGENEDNNTYPGHPPSLTGTKVAHCDQPAYWAGVFPSLGRLTLGRLPGQDPAGGQVTSLLRLLWWAWGEDTALPGPPSQEPTNGTPTFRDWMSFFTATAAARGHANPMLTYPLLRRAVVQGYTLSRAPQGFALTAVDLRILRRMGQGPFLGFNEEFLGALGRAAPCLERLSITLRVVLEECTRRKVASLQRAAQGAGINPQGDGDDDGNVDLTGVPETFHLDVSRYPRLTHLGLQLLCRPAGSTTRGMLLDYTRTAPASWVSVRHPGLRVLHVAYQRVRTDGGWGADQVPIGPPAEEDPADDRLPELTGSVYNVEWLAPPPLLVEADQLRALRLSYGMGCLPNAAYLAGCPVPGQRHQHPRLATLVVEEGEAWQDSPFSHPASRLVRLVPEAPRPEEVRADPCRARLMTLTNTGPGARWMPVLGGYYPALERLRLGLQEAMQDIDCRIALPRLESLHLMARPYPPTLPEPPPPKHEHEATPASVIEAVREMYDCLRGRISMPGCRSYSHLTDLPPSRPDGSPLGSRLQLRCPALVSCQVATGPTSTAGYWNQMWVPPQGAPLETPLDWLQILCPNPACPSSHHRHPGRFQPPAASSGPHRHHQLATPPTAGPCPHCGALPLPRLRDWCLTCRVGLVDTPGEYALPNSQSEHLGGHEDELAGAMAMAIRGKYDQDEMDAPPLGGDGGDLDVGATESACLTRLEIRLPPAADRVHLVGLPALTAITITEFHHARHFELAECPQLTSLVLLSYPHAPDNKLPRPEPTTQPACSGPRWHLQFHPTTIFVTIFIPTITTDCLIHPSSFSLANDATFLQSTATFSNTPPHSHIHRHILKSTTTATPSRRYGTARARRYTLPDPAAAEYHQEWLDERARRAEYRMSIEGLSKAERRKAQRFERSGRESRAAVIREKFPPFSWTDPAPRLATLRLGSLPALRQAILDLGATFRQGIPPLGRPPVALHWGWQPPRAGGCPEAGGAPPVGLYPNLALLHITRAIVPAVLVARQPPPAPAAAAAETGGAAAEGGAARAVCVAPGLRWLRLVSCATDALRVEGGPQLTECTAWLASVHMSPRVGGLVVEYHVAIVVTRGTQVVITAPELRSLRLLPIPTVRRNDQEHHIGPVPVHFALHRELPCRLDCPALRHLSMADIPPQLWLSPGVIASFVGIPSPVSTEPAQAMCSLRILQLGCRHPRMIPGTRELTLDCEGLPCLETIKAWGPLARVRVLRAPRVEAVWLACWTWLEELRLETPALGHLALHTARGRHATTHASCQARARQGYQPAQWAQSAPDADSVAARSPSPPPPAAPLVVQVEGRLEELMLTGTQAMQILGLEALPVHDARMRAICLVPEALITPADEAAIGYYRQATPHLVRRRLFVLPARPQPSDGTDNPVVYRHMDGHHSKEGEHACRMPPPFAFPGEEWSGGETDPHHLTAVDPEDNELCEDDSERAEDARVGDFPLGRPRRASRRSASQRDSASLKRPLGRLPLYIRPDQAPPCAPLVDVCITPGMLGQARILEIPLHPVARNWVQRIQPQMSNALMGRLDLTLTPHLRCLVLPAAADLILRRSPDMPPLFSVKDITPAASMPPPAPRVGYVPPPPPLADDGEPAELRVVVWCPEVMPRAGLRDDTWCDLFVRAYQAPPSTYQHSGLAHRSPFDPPLRGPPALDHTAISILMQALCSPQPALPDLPRLACAIGPFDVIHELPARHDLAGWRDGVPRRGRGGRLRGYPRRVNPDAAPRPLLARSWGWFGVEPTWPSAEMGLQMEESAPLEEDDE
ncbi:hypothetical protein PAPYR_8058 [Paratrimastix pyriformis]|uniref:F-box domain-containing protein n=1 Tax=Paratrimastix pyriformis TaxID=342808 RepID=A0ABQ8UIL6_9EUKA|nr:hypothetical protein PAPYR_8058 [Paratrimastix pyriformis]